MAITTLHDQCMMYVSTKALVSGNNAFPSLLKENERMVFDLQSRTLILTAGDMSTQVIRLSPIDTHLMLPLLYFYPHYVSDSTLAIGYSVNLSTYYRHLKGEIETEKREVSYPLADGIERLKKKVISLGLTVTRVRNTGYILERGADVFSKKKGQV